jgi:hypothetical protein
MIDRQMLTTHLIGFSRSLAGAVQNELLKRSNALLPHPDLPSEESRPDLPSGESELSVTSKHDDAILVREMKTGFLMLVQPICYPLPSPEFMVMSGQAMAQRDPLVPPQGKELG